MSFLHQSEKPPKYYDDSKVSDPKDPIEYPSEALNEKLRNSSTTSRTSHQNNTNLMPLEEETSKQHQKTNNNNGIHEEGIKNNKIERPPLNDMPFINYAKKRKTSQHYIRIRKVDMLPRNDIYEATDEDLDFIASFNSENKDANSLTNEILEQLIVLWENNSEKDYPIALPTARSLTADKLEESLFGKIEDVYNVSGNKKYK